jgi:hypothetical protein
MSRIILAALALTLAALPATAWTSQPPPPEPEYSTWLHWYNLCRTARLGAKTHEMVCIKRDQAALAVQSLGWGLGSFEQPSALSEIPDAMEIIGGSKRTNEPPDYTSVEPRCFMSPHRSDFVCKPGEVDGKGGQRVGVVWWAGVMPGGGVTDISPELAKCWGSAPVPNWRVQLCYEQNELGEDQP